MIYMLVEREQYEPDVKLGFYDSLEKAQEAQREYEEYLIKFCKIDIENYGLWCEIRSYEINKRLWMG